MAYSAEPLVEEAEVRGNRRKAQLIALVGMLLPALVLGGVFAGVVSVLVGVIAFGVVVVFGPPLILRVATRCTLKVLGARPVGEREFVHLDNLIDGLCPTFGVRRPKLMVVDDDVPNVCCLGARRDRGVLVVTTGVEATLDLIEMEGVIGHELAHLKRGDTAVSGVAVTVLAPIIWVSRGDRLLHRVLGRGRELRADHVAVRAVRYPPGLHGALVRFASAGTPAPGSVFASRRFAMTRWIWIDPSVAHRSESEVGDLDGTSVRIDALAEF